MSENQTPTKGETKNQRKTQTRIDFAVGGQAVIEGVMMRSPNFITVAVRKSKGDIKIKEEPFKSFCLKVKIFGIPIVRGVVNLFEMMMVGSRILNFSANEALEDAEEDSIKKDDATKHKKSKIEPTKSLNSENHNPLDTSKSESGLNKFFNIASLLFSLFIALGLSLFLFKFLPLWITDFISKKFEVVNQNYLLFNLIDGLIKTIFFVVYIGLLGLTPSLKRVFQYHGAEHKSIYTYEQGLELTTENARRMTRFHPRCGTSFILVVFLISIFIYTFVPRQPDLFVNFSVRLIFLPIIAGFSYELLKWSAKKQRTFLVRMITAPGLWFQRFTTREPDDQQLEVALTALKKALELEESRISSTKPALEIA